MAASEFDSQLNARGQRNSVANCCVRATFAVATPASGGNIYVLHWNIKFKIIKYIYVYKSYRKCNFKVSVAYFLFTLDYY